MSEETENESEILCVVERRSDVGWVIREIEDMVPELIELVPSNDNEHVEIWAIPGLTEKERKCFKKMFEDEEYTDVAWLNN